MTRTTTPVHAFRLPFEPSLIRRFLLTYSQNGEVLLEKNETQLSVVGNTWLLTLTQEETNLFSSGWADVEVRVLTTSGVALPAWKTRFNVKGVVNDKVLT